jgi:hypothetical protein
LAIEVARALIRAGVPVFAARPAMRDGEWDPRGGTDYCGYWLPPEWQKTVPAEEWLDPAAGPTWREKAWRPGWALGAVMGHEVDGLDVDPRNGGTDSITALQAAGMVPRTTGRQRTPSDGWHALIAPLGVGSANAVRPGLDVKGGKPDGSGRGFLFIAPTVKLSKTTGRLEPYVWEVPPDLDELDGDTSGEALAALIAASRDRRGGTPTADEFLNVDRHTGPIADGRRHEALVSYAGRLRDRRLTLEEAKVLFERRWKDCAQPPAARHPVTWDDALDKLRDVFDRYPPGRAEQLAPAGTVPADDLPELLSKELAEDPLLAAEVENVQRGRRARHVADEIEELRHPKPPPDAGTLAELLTRPVSTRWRIEGVLPTGGRATVVSQRKLGKTTLTGNLARSLLTGEQFLDSFPVERLTGRVVTLNYEVTGEQYAAWMDDIGVPRDRLYVVNMRGRRNLLADEDGRRELIELIQAQDGEVLIVDPFGRAYTGRSQYDPAEVTPWLVRLDEVAEQAGVRELVMTVHAGWDGERTRGSTALEDWPDSIVTMTRDAEAGERFLRAEGRDVDLDEDRLDYDPETRRLRLSGAGSRQQVRQSERGERLARLVAEIVPAQPGINVTGIEAALRERGESLQKGDTSKACHLAEKRGTIRREHKGRSVLHFPAGHAPTNPDVPPGQVTTYPDPPIYGGYVRGLISSYLPRPPVALLRIGRPTSRPGIQCVMSAAPLT